MLNPHETFVVLDTWEDTRFSDNVLVASDPKIRFYAGMPLNIRMKKEEEGAGGVGLSHEPRKAQEAGPGGVELCMGTLCLIDDRPHREFSPHERKMLHVLSRMAADALQAQAPWPSRCPPGPGSSSRDRCGLARVRNSPLPLPSELLHFSQERDVLLILGQGEGGEAPVLVCSPGLERVLGRTIADTMGRDFRDFLFPDREADRGTKGPISSVAPGREDNAGVLEKGTFTSLAQSLLGVVTEEALGTEGEMEGWVPRESPPAGPGGRVWAHLSLKTVGDRRLLVHLQDRTASALELQSAKRGMATAEAAALAKSRFLANMSHELRTPMNAINACSLLLSEERLTVAQAELVQMIGMSCTQMLDFLNQVLDFSKLDSKRLDPVQRVFMQFNGRQCVEKVLESLGILANRKGVDLGYVIDEGIPDTWCGDEIQFRQVLINLTSNAVKFTERGHVCIYVKRIVGVSEGRSTDREEWLEIQVKDTGKGVPPEAMDVIFHPFEQVDSSLTRDISGTGLGLSISKMIVEGLGGEIKAESVVGRGSTFTCTFPFRTTSHKRGKEEVEPDPTPWGEVLVIMQSLVIGETVGSILKKIGLRHRCIIPNQLPQLLAEEGSASRYGLVVLDHQPVEMSEAWVDCARVVIPWAKAATATKKTAKGRNSGGAPFPVLLLKLHRNSGTGYPEQVFTSQGGIERLNVPKAALKRPCHSEPSLIFSVPSDVSIASGAANGAGARTSPLLQTWKDLWSGMPYLQLFKPITLTKMQDLLMWMQTPTQKSRLSSEAGGAHSPNAGGAPDGPGVDRPKQGSTQEVRILVCEDNLVNQRVLIKILESLGYSNVVLANNGVEGLKAVQQSAFNLVLMDIHMPAMDGLQACKEITHPSTPCVGGQAPPVVALTADVVSDIRNRCEEVGMVGYLKKPINRNELLEIITRYTRRG